MAKTWKQVWFDPRPVSFATFMLWGYVWTFLGCAMAGYMLVEAYEASLASAVAFGLFMLIPVPFLVWSAGRMMDRDRRVGVKPVGAP